MARCKLCLVEPFGVRYLVEAMTRRSHQWIDERARALARAVADKLLAHPELMEIGLRNIDRWSAAEVGCAAALREWRELLERGSVAVVVDLLCEESERAARMRQSNPFAGVLSPQERWGILRDYETRAA